MNASVEVVAVEPGDSFDLAWDGRAKTPFQEFTFCEEGGTCESSTVGAARPLEPGPITMTIPLYDAEGSYGEDFSDGGICPSPLQISVDFELGSEDLIVPVALSEVVIG